MEDWLGKVEEAMFGNLRKLTKSAIADYERRPREDWVVCHASQVSFISHVVSCHTSCVSPPSLTEHRLSSEWVVNYVMCCHVTLFLCMWRVRVCMRVCVRACVCVCV